jgi:hypothetical protein
MHVVGVVASPVPAITPAYPVPDAFAAHAEAMIVVVEVTVAIPTMNPAVVVDVTWAQSPPPWAAGAAPGVDTVAWNRDHPVRAELPFEMVFEYFT